MRKFRTVYPTLDEITELVGLKIVKVHNDEKNNEYISGYCYYDKCSIFEFDDGSVLVIVYARDSNGGTSIDCIHSQDEFKRMYNLDNFNPTSIQDVEKILDHFSFMFSEEEKDEIVNMFNEHETRRAVQKEEEERELYSKLKEKYGGDKNEESRNFNCS